MATTDAAVGRAACDPIIRARKASLEQQLVGTIRPGTSSASLASGRITEQHSDTGDACNDCGTAKVAEDAAL